MKWKKQFSKREDIFNFICNIFPWLSNKNKNELVYVKTRFPKTGARKRLLSFLYCGDVIDFKGIFNNYEKKSKLDIKNLPSSNNFKKKKKKDIYFYTYSSIWKIINQ